MLRLDRALLWRGTGVFSRAGAGGDGEAAVLCRTFSSSSLLLGNRRSTRTTSLILRTNIVLLGTLQRLPWRQHVVSLLPVASAGTLRSGFPPIVGAGLLLSFPSR
ncbi:hypothetical protein EYF80_002352 [Liparis tanakae]|uniref:Uncharacterized protein n=1 Tax=Liparis tanakae TaxID=230148 RepID=A0A4Z2JAL2_9TELE|nr:hypothetical protein EYF80_002352 [Liparis tanakae]